MPELSAVIFIPDDTAKTGQSRPTMLQNIMGTPLLAWLSHALVAGGVGRFFLVSHERFKRQARECFPQDIDFRCPAADRVSDELHVFLSTADESEQDIIVVTGPAVILPYAADEADFDGPPLKSNVTSISRQTLMEALDDKFIFTDFLKEHGVPYTDRDGVYSVASMQELANMDIGLYKFRKELIEELIRRGHEVVLSLPSGEAIEHFEKMGCRFIDTPVDRRGINPVKDLSLFRRYRRMIKNVDPDLIVTYTIKPNVYGGIAARLAKKRYAVNITGLGTAFEKPGAIRTLVVGMYKLALKKAKVVFFENSGDRDELLSFGVCDRSKTCVLNGAGVNLDTYSYAEYPHNDKPRFLYIGRIMKEKGIDELLAAAKRLACGDTPCCLDVVGTFEEDYSAKLKECEAEGWLKYHGFQSDIRPFAAQSDCFVLPSYHEGMANTNLECASIGRPLITSDIPGCREAVIKDVSGFLCKPKDADSLYSAMSSMAKLPAETRAEMGRAGRKHMEEVFDKRKVVEKTVGKLLDEN